MYIKLVDLSLAPDPQCDGAFSPGRCGGRVHQDGHITVGVVREGGGRGTRPAEHVQHTASLTMRRERE